MNKKLNFTIVLVLLFGLAQGQSLLKIGLRGAYTTSSIETDIPTIISRTMTGHQIGAFVRLGKKWYIQPEILYSAQGGKLDLQTDVNGKRIYLTQTIHLETVDIPVMLGYHFINTGLFNLRVQAGPSFNSIIDKNIYISNNAQNTVTEEELINQINNDYINLLLGVGIDISFVTLDFRYEIGTGNLYNDTYPSDFNISSYHNNVLIVSLGIKFLSIL